MRVITVLNGGKPRVPPLFSSCMNSGCKRPGAWTSYGGDWTNAEPGATKRGHKFFVIEVLCDLSWAVSYWFNSSAQTRVLWRWYYKRKILLSLYSISFDAMVHFSSLQRELTSLKLDYKLDHVIILRNPSTTLTFPIIPTLTVTQKFLRSSWSSTGVMNFSIGKSFVFLHLKIPCDIFVG